MGEYASVTTQGNVDQPQPDEVGATAPNSSIEVGAEAPAEGTQEGTHEAPAEGTQEAPVTPAVPERPAWLPQKFSSPEEMAASYTELERKQSQEAANRLSALEAENARLRAGGKPEDAPAENNTEAQQTPTQPFEQATPESLSKYVQEYVNGGQISEASYSELQARFNLNRQMADSHIRAKRAEAELYADQAMQQVGGQKEFMKMSVWAQENLSPAEQRVFNQDVGSGSEDRIKAAIANLAARYASGRTPNLVKGAPQSQSVVGFKSEGEMIAAINDPRYESDPAFRDQVTAKIQAGNV